MAHFDAYGRGLRGDGGPDYYETYQPYNPYDSNRHMPGAYSTSSSKYTGEPRDIPYAPQSASNVPPPPPPPATQPSQSSYSSSNNMGMPYDSDRPSPRENNDGVSPDIIAAITEKVKRELTNLEPRPCNVIIRLLQINPLLPQIVAEFTLLLLQQVQPDGAFLLLPLNQCGRRQLALYRRSRRYASLIVVELITIRGRRPFIGVIRRRNYQPLIRNGDGYSTVDDFAPKKSIVITPLKMAAYYGAYPIDREMHSYTFDVLWPKIIAYIVFLAIFKSTSNSQISKLYQDLGCQHHLVQDDNNSAPTIPALTPLGFAHWMTIQISAYPDEESKRLEKVVLALPINADGPMVDGKPERLPKQISRHLLPSVEDRESQKLLKTAINRFFDELGISPSRSKPTTSSPPLRQTSPAQQSRPVDIPTRASQSTSASKPIERERAPYAGAPSVVSESSSADDASGPPLERERKPYSAQPGSGKFHTEPTNFNTTTNRPGRANSTTRSKEPERERSRETRHKRTQSNSSQNEYKPPPLSSSSKRNRSPQFKSYSHSTPNDINIGATSYAPSASFPPAVAPSSYGSSNFFPPPPSATSEPSHTRDRRRDERFPHRRGTEEERFSTTEFTSPRDAEKWDRLYDRGSLSDYDPRDRDRGDKSSTTSYETRSTRKFDKFVGWGGCREVVGGET
ncbi:hydroxyproline-rich glyco DZ-HRGP protein [Rutstroemia sp. NJR-2017a BBW]|nr:hydroxyproline-rich glyco DZ-HRGP protein [Rutstroemia sp. NJR-2017a BBW]